MLYLAGAIVLSSWLTIAFKIAGRLGISTFQAIIFNYLTCVITGILLEGQIPEISSIAGANWFFWALLMGSMFISIFNLVAYTTKKSGVAIASVANKLSLVIPFVFSIFLYHESVTYIKIVGVFIALIAVLLTCMPSSSSEKKSSMANLSILLFPLLLFISSGLLDTLIKYVEINFIDESNNNLYIITAFGVAGIIGSLILLWMLIAGRERFDPRAIGMGMLIGIPNYFSLWCLVRVLKIHAGNSSSVIPITNMGIVLFSTLIAALFLHERLSKLNILGIVLSIIAISMIAFG
jgi:drug/metabolite transporter (DMT)-like permease